MTTLLDRVNALAAPHGLMAMGGLQEDGNTLILVGADTSFWDVFQNSPEAGDNAPDPIDRWSQRILPMIASQANAVDVQFPFGGPPYTPFIQWAKQSGEAFASPVGMLVHTHAGMMISYRGALVFAGLHTLPKAEPSPCVACADTPCTQSCPVGALSAEAPYDVAACKAFLNTSAGADCMQHGCKARRACPVSQRFGRIAEQSAAHMKAFNP